MFKLHTGNSGSSPFLCNYGGVVTIELVLVSVVALIGLIVALASVRDSVVSELVDTSLTVQSSNQSLVFNGTVGPSSTTAGSGWNDAVEAGGSDDIAGAVASTDFDVAPQQESSLESFLESNNFEFNMTRNGFTWTGTGTFAEGIYNGSPFWPGTYTIDGTTITITLNPLGGGWEDGTIELDASDVNNINGEVTWINSITGFVWEAIYELFLL